MVKQQKIIPVYFSNGTPATRTLEMQIGFIPKFLKVISSTDFATPCWITTSIINGQIAGVGTCQFPIEWELSNHFINNTQQTVSLMTNTGVLNPGVDVVVSVIFTAD